MSQPSQPSLTVTSSHIDPFFVGQTNASYTLTVTNAGGQATSGAVTLTETLPSARTLSSRWGPGWTCSGANCTNSSSVAAGASFPPVFVAVVPPVVAMAANNQVSVSGGGSAAANASDGTNIVGATSNCLTITIRPQTAVANGATVSPANQCYTNPTLVDVIAYSAGAYTFSSFSGGLTGTSNNQTVMVSGSVNITAHFKTTFTLSPANQNANIAIPANGTPVPATYAFSSGDPQCISTCGDYDSSGNLSPYVTATITGRNASSLSIQYTAAPGAVGSGQARQLFPICPCFDGACVPPVIPPADAEVSPTITFNGTTVASNTTSNVIIGQQINLSVSVDSGTISDASWFAPGTITGGFTGSGSGSTQLGVNMDQVSPTFYWVDANSSRTVSVDVTLSDGTTGTATTTFNVVAPTGSMAITPEPGVNVTLDSNCNNTLEAHYGCNTGVGGMFFKNNYSTPSGYSGSYQWVQTVISSASQTTTSGTVENLGPFGGSPPCAGLDLSYPYSTIMPETSDSPGTALQTGYQERTRNDSFTMTLMFQPSNVGSATFVPIASGGWAWNFDATSSNGGSTWNLINSGYNGGPAPATTTYPFWTYTIQNTCVYN